MLDVLQVAETLHKALQQAERHDFPYPLTVFSPFSESLYDEILAQLPDDQFYTALKHVDAVRPDGTSTRGVLSLADAAIGRLPPEQRDFWQTFNAVMRSRPVRDVFMEHLEAEIVARFGCPLRDLSCYPTARLGRDRDGYRISPHPDAESRVYTAQVYLAKDDSQIAAGTSVYQQLDDGGFATVRRLPYLPNTGFCFARSDKTFHGVEPLSLDRPRDNLHISGFVSAQNF